LITQSVPDLISDQQDLARKKILWPAVQRLAGLGRRHGRQGR